MRDVLFLEINEQMMAIATDCSGAIGLKEMDDVQVPYNVVAYYAMRVAMMEILSVGAIPKTCIVQNFNGESAWEQLIEGIEQLLSELEYSLPITGSSETNFALVQSATGISVLGSVEKRRIKCTPNEASFAVIGTPLVGIDIIGKPELMLPLPLFKELLQITGIYEIIPVGSKGVLHELYIVGCVNKSLSCYVPLDVSAGPASCVVISYDDTYEEQIKSVAQNYFFKIQFTK